jgi:hypothetical protein
MEPYEVAPFALSFPLSLKQNFLVRQDSGLESLAGCVPFQAATLPPHSCTASAVVCHVAARRAATLPHGFSPLPAMLPAPVARFVLPLFSAMAGKRLVSLTPGKIVLDFPQRSHMAPPFFYYKNTREPAAY